MSVNLQAARWLGLGVALGFLFDWIAVWREWKPLKPFTKPLAMLMVILWTAFSAQQVSPAVGLLLAAQTFGLLGDILLLFPEQAFSLGLGSFLVGHLVYLGLLISTLPSLLVHNASNLPAWGWLLIGLLLWIGILLFVYRLFSPLPEQRGVSKGLWIAIQGYSWVLSAMVAVSLITALQSSGRPRIQLALPLGALLFLVSDSMLTYDRFIQAFHRAQLWVRISYHLAQFALAWGFLALLP